MLKFADWRLERFAIACLLYIVASVTAIYTGIPIVQQVLAFVLLSFLPGLIVLRAFRVRGINPIEGVLYALGISLFFDMAVAALGNFLIPALGIERPFAVIPMLILFTLSLIVLLAIAYISEKLHKQPLNRETNDAAITWESSIGKNINQYLLAALFPLLAIAGTSVINYYENNSLIFLLISLVILVIILVSINRFITPAAYPFFIVGMSIALMYQTTLISVNLVGSDIHVEYNLARQTLVNGYWDTRIHIMMDSCLSIVLLGPLYSLLMNIDLVWIFKAVYPLLGAFLPLALYRVFMLQFSPRLAFLTTIFFITTPMFTMDLAQLMRQQVAELFFVLFILLLIDRRLTGKVKFAMSVIFGLGVIISYYGMGIGFTGYIFFTTIAVMVLKSGAGRHIWSRAMFKRSVIPPDLYAKPAIDKVLMITLTAISIVFTVIYYQVVASGASSQGGASVFAVILDNTGVGKTQDIFAGFLSIISLLIREPLTQTALGLDFLQVSTNGKIWRIFQYIVQLCLLLGMLRLIFDPGSLGRKIRTEYIALTFGSFLVMAGVFLIPTVSYGLGVTRVWQITLLLMSPFFFLGAEWIFAALGICIRAMSDKFAGLRIGIDGRALLLYPAIMILIPYYIYNSGAVFEISRSNLSNYIDVPYSISLSNYRTNSATAFSCQDSEMSAWVNSHANQDYTKAVDYNGYYLLWHYDLWGGKWVGVYCEELNSPMYALLNTWNTQTGQFTLGTAYAVRENRPMDSYPAFSELLRRGNVIYINGFARVIISE